MTTEQDVLSQNLDSSEEKILGISITIDDIREKIKQLGQTAEGEQLRGAMNDLKIALKANPEACNLLMPEEIGEMVKHLYKVTNTAVVTEKAKATKKISEKTFKDLLKDPNAINNLTDF